MPRDIICLGIETSCDETSVAVVKNGREILSNVVATQIEIHKKFGGVVPEIASRNHVDNITHVINEALFKANMKLENVDIIACTYGPGLIGALLVGVATAKAIAYAVKKPLVGVNHIEGHIAANYITHKNLTPPYLCLIVSGGHSHLVHVKDYTKFEVLGKTRDDAVGEAFDKVARVLNLGYPGGPIIDKLAKDGKPTYKLPRTYFDNLDFSFSGIKTAVINLVNKEKENININDLCASFQEAVTDVLIENLLKATSIIGTTKIAIAGGVSANSYLRKRAEIIGVIHNIKVYYPELILCTDNAAMIASAAYYNYLAGKISELNLNAIPNLKIGEI